MMKKELIETLPYDEVNFRWISNHYDVHLNGTCMFNGKLCEFENEYPDFDEEIKEMRTVSLYHDLYGNDLDKI